MRHKDVVSPTHNIPHGRPSSMILRFLSNHCISTLVTSIAAMITIIISWLLIFSKNTSAQDIPYTEYVNTL